jgi:hypothetical protein
MAFEAMNVDEQLTPPLLFASSSSARQRSALKRAFEEAATSGTQPITYPASLRLIMRGECRLIHHGRFAPPSK